MVALFVWSSFLFYWCTQTIPILNELFYSTIWYTSIHTNAKCCLRNLCAIMNHKIIIIIVKSVNIHIHCVYKKSFWPAYAQLGMLSAPFATVPIVTVKERTKCYTSTSFGMVDPEIIALNPKRKKIFYACSTWPPTSDDKINVLLLLYIAKLQAMREYIQSLRTLHIDNIIGNFDLKTVSLGWRFSLLGLPNWIAD